MQINLQDLEYCFINLDRDTDRLRGIKNELSAVGVFKMSRFPGVEHEVGHIGLAKAQEVLLTNMRVPFVALEDDAVVKKFVNTISVPDDADGVYLGTSNWALQGKKTTHFLRYRNTGVPGVLQISNMLSAHAILYLSDDFRRANLAATLRSQQPPYRPIDYYFAKNQKEFKIYCIDEPVFVQGTYKKAMSDAPLWTGKRLTEYSRGYQLLGLKLPLPRWGRKLETREPCLRRIKGYLGVLSHRNR